MKMVCQVLTLIFMVGNVTLIFSPKNDNRATILKTANHHKKCFEDHKNQAGMFDRNEPLFETVKFIITEI